MSLLRSLTRSAPLLGALACAACATSAPAARPDPGPASTSGSRVDPSSFHGSQASTPPNAAAGPCAALAACGACAANAACRFCTEPRACVPSGAACTGLLLGHPGTCENDPVERARQHTAREEARARLLTAEGPPVVGQLSSFPGVHFNVVRGRCYALIVRFGVGARMGDVTPDEQLRTREESTSGSSLAQPSRPGLPSNLYCPRSPGELSFWFEDRWTRARVTAAGHGEVSVQLYSTPISEADLKAGDEKQAAIDRKIDAMPAGCDDCDDDCRAAGTACEHRCFVDTAGGARAGRELCNSTCAQITRACQAGCEARCR